MRSVIWVLNMFAVFGSPTTPGNNQAAFEPRMSVGRKSWMYSSISLVRASSNVKSRLTLFLTS